MHTRVSRVGLVATRRPLRSASGCDRPNVAVRSRLLLRQFSASRQATARLWGAEERRACGLHAQRAM
jgi:hypothetical protein